MTCGVLKAVYCCAAGFSSKALPNKGVIGQDDFEVHCTLAQFVRLTLRTGRSACRSLSREDWMYQLA